MTTSIASEHWRSDTQIQDFAPYSDLFPFSKTACLINSSEVESVSDPGPATLVKNLLLYDENFNASTAMSLCWVRDTEDGAMKETNMEVLYRCKHTLKLSRNTDGNAIFRGPASTTDGSPFKVGMACKIILNKLMWFMPHLWQVGLQP